MKARFMVQEMEDLESLGLALKGRVILGKLIPGMEAQHEGTVVIIRDLMSASKQKKPLTVARTGQKVRILPKATVADLLKKLEGQLLEFEDIRTIPIKNSLVLDPEPFV